MLPPPRGVEGGGFFYKSCLGGLWDWTYFSSALPPCSTPTPHSSPHTDRQEIPFNSKELWVFKTHLPKILGLQVWSELVQSWDSLWFGHIITWIGLIHKNEQIYHPIHVWYSGLAETGHSLKWDFRRGFLGIILSWGFSGGPSVKR